jgi:hypothetical protein
MKKLVIVSALLIVVLSFFQSCEIQSFNGTWAQSVSNNNDSLIFKSPLRFYDTNTRLQYSICNDTKNIYIYIKATEKMAQLKILRSGLLLKIDTLGKHTYQKTLLYPIIGKKGAKPVPMISEKDWDVFVSRFSYDHSFMKITGFPSYIDDEIPIKNENGISVSITWDRFDVLLYKATIPFSQIISTRKSVSDSTMKIGFSFYLKALVDAAKEKQQSAGTTTADSRYQEDQMKRNNAARGNSQSSPQNDQQTYLFNIRSLQFNYIPAVKPN